MRDPLKMSQAQERRVAKKIGGKVTAASGAFWSRKGDVQNGRYKGEAKATEKQSISVKADVWNKIHKEALLDGRIPVLFLQLAGSINLVVMDEEDWLADRQRLGEMDVE